MLLKLARCFDYQLFNPDSALRKFYTPAGLPERWEFKRQGVATSLRVCNLTGVLIQVGELSETA